MAIDPVGVRLSEHQTTLRSVVRKSWRSPREGLQA
jgi:hypothetical protein